MVLYMATFCLFELVLLVALVIVLASTDLDNAKEQELAVIARGNSCGLRTASTRPMCRSLSLPTIFFFILF